MMIKNILQLMPGLNLFGGSKKIRDLINNSKHNHFIYCWDCWEGEKLYNTFKQKWIKDNIVIFEGFYGRNLFKHIYSILKICNKHHIDIIHAYFNYDAFLCAIIKRLKPSIKIVVSFEGVVNPSNYLLTSLLKMSYRKVDFFIYISEYVKEAKQGKFSILKNKKGRVIYNGATIPTVNPLDHVSYDAETILTIGGLNEYKNITLLIEVMNILINDYKRRIILNIIGDGPQKDMCKNQIRKFSLEKYVNLLGYRSNIGDFLNSSTLYVHPAHKEGFGIAVVEAMLMKKAVILSNAGALPELIVDNESGLLAKPYDPHDWAQKIIMLLDNSSLREKIAINGYKRAMSLFNIKRFVEDYDKVYENI